MDLDLELYMANSPELEPMFMIVLENETIYRRFADINEAIAYCRDFYGTELTEIQEIENQ